MCFPPLNNKTSFQIYYLITFLFLYCAPLLILMILYTLISRRLWQRKILGIVTEERQTESSEQEKGRVIMALISIAVVFAAHNYYELYDIFSKYGCLSKNSDGGWMVVLLHGFGHANSCVHPCLYVLLSQGYRRRNSANPPTFRIFWYLSLQKLVLSNFLLFQY